MCPMSPRLLRPRASNNNVASDADARAYIEAVRLADGQYMEPAVQLAVNAFVVGCKADGIWSAIKASCILMGARTLLGALTPLVGSAPTNNGPFVSGDYNRKTGLVGDGSGKYLDTNRAGNADPQDDVHFCVYVTTYANGQSGYRAFMGSGDSQNGASNIFWSGPAVGSGQRSRNSTAQTNAPSSIAGALSPGLFGISRSSSASYSLRANQSAISVSVASQAPLADDWWVFTTNNAGATVLPTSSRLNFYSTGTSLSLASLDSRVTGLAGDIAYAVDNPAASAASLHPEAQDWVRRVYANGGTVSATTANAVNDFCNSIDAAGIRDKFYRLNLFCGDQLAAALVPLYRAESRTASARGNTTDTNNNFVSGDFNNTGSSSGLQGNGSTKFLNTGLAANTISGNNAHFGSGLLARTDTSGYRSAMGIWGGGASGTAGQIYQLSIRRADANRVAAFGNVNAGLGFFGEQANGVNIAVGNIVAAWPTQYRNGSAVGVDATASENYSSAHSIYVFALNNGSTSAAVDHVTGRLGWYSIGLTMTSSQVVAFNNALNAFATTLGRT